MLSDIRDSSIQLGFDENNNQTPIKSFWDHSLITGLTKLTKIYFITVQINTILLIYKSRPKDELEYVILQQQPYQNEIEKDNIIKKFVEDIYEHINQKN